MERIPRPAPLRRPHTMTRRQALVALGGGALVAVGCSSSSNEADSTSPSSTTTADGQPSALVQIFPASGYVVSGIEQRMAFSLGGSTGVPMAEGVPGGLQFTVLRLDGDPSGSEEVVGTSLGTVDVPAHRDGVPIAYYPLRFTFDEPGFYGIRAVGDGIGALDANLSVSGPAEIALIQPGSRLPILPTPTVEDAQGVVPICTRDPECPFHDVSLESVAREQPIALLVSTPEFCQIGVCGPVLDLLMEESPTRSSVQIIHCEVYADEEGPTGGNLAPIVGALGMGFEPALYLVGPDGVVVDRLDNVFDRSEIADGLDRLASMERGS